MDTSVRIQLEEIEKETLSPYATLSVNTKGRLRDEEQCDIRPVIEQGGAAFPKLTGDERKINSLFLILQHLAGPGHIFPHIAENADPYNLLLRPDAQGTAHCAFIKLRDTQRLPVKSFSLRRKRDTESTPLKDRKANLRLHRCDLPRQGRGGHKTPLGGFVKALHADNGVKRFQLINIHVLRASSLGKERKHCRNYIKTQRALQDAQSPFFSDCAILKVSC